MRLDAIDKALLGGELGAPAQKAMRLLLRYGEVLGANGFVDIASAHIDSCLYHGQSGLDFVQFLLDGDFQVRVPTTLNVTAFDLENPGYSEVSPEVVRIQKKMVDAYLRLGCRPTLTCAPYQRFQRPQKGQHIAWAESNAIVFANSVLGARTDRYGDFTDICAALTGRVPLAGLHRSENRFADMVLEVPGPEECGLERDLYFASLGYVLGEQAGSRVAAIQGGPADTSEDELKSVGAAAASSGAVAMFHMVGVTPEAATLEKAAGGQASDIRTLGRAGFTAVSDRLCRVEPGETVAALCVGTPHFSLQEFRRLAKLMHGRRAAPGVDVLVSTSREIAAQIDQQEWAGSLLGFGVKTVLDTCTYLVRPTLRGKGVVVTNSAKWAHYAPGNTGRRPALMSLERCVRCAEKGRVVA
ncbi:MAG: aconitase X catalytic domain-containing protein [Xanthomonadales bacterium]|nr:aconitase X catalytic domain-containing protein [Xanthomonadales bacterium]